MNRRNLLLFIFAAAAVTAFGFADASSRSYSDDSQTAMVALGSDRAEPDILTVKVGQNVQFNAKDGQSHSLLQGSPNGDHEHTPGTFESGVFKPDEGWRVNFKQPGTYKFYDQLNPNLQITVVAYRPSK